MFSFFRNRTATTDFSADELKLLLKAVAMCEDTPDFSALYFRLEALLAAKEKQSLTPCHPERSEGSRVL